MRLAVLALLALGCSSAEQPASPPGAIEDHPAAAHASPPPGARVVVQERHLAVFVDDVLDECKLVRAEWTIPQGIDWTPPEMEDLVPEEEADGRFTIALARPCEEELRDRIALATCVESHDDAELQVMGLSGHPGVAPPAGVSATIAFRLMSYRFETALQDDRRMRHCMQGHGEWTTVARDSPEYERARLDQREREQRRVAPPGR